MISRRTFLTTAATAIGATAGLGTYVRFLEPYWLDLVRRELPIARLPQSLVGKTLAQLTDLHAGPVVPDDYLERVFAQVAAEQPDIVAYTGDFLSLEPTSLERVNRVYATAPRGRLATVGVLGNHDYGWRWVDYKFADTLVDVLRNHGIPILRNELYDVDGLQLVGLDDMWAQRFNLEKGFAKVHADGATLTLSHNPDTLDWGGWGSYAGWVLSGHTHGGQVRAPFLSPPILPVANKRYTAGEIALADGRRVYIGRGIGHNIAVRFNVRPEVTLFTLVRT
jgi:uncharacterized protein